MRKDSKILSQWEIDALLKNLPADDDEAATALTSVQTSGTQEHRNIKPYDFRRPDKFSKDQLRALQALHQAYARLAGTALSSQLRSVVSVKVSSIEQSLYEEYVQQLPNPTVLYIVGMDPLPGSIIVEYNMDLALVCIDRLLGGAGEVLDRPHEMTDIEITLLRSLSRSFLSTMAEAWENLAPIRPKLQDIALSSQLVQVATTGDVCIVVLFEVHIGEVMGGMSICLPYTVLESVLPKLANQAFLVSGQRRVAKDSDKIALRQNLRRANIPLIARLGTAEVTTRELLEMQVGDVLRLDAPLSRPLEVIVTGQPKFLGYPGLTENRLGIQVSSVLRDEESEVDERAG